MNTSISRIMSDFDRLTQRFIGLDHIFERHLDPIGSKYPPYNIIKENDGTYSIELAVAGFKLEDIDISISNNELLIRGKHEDNREDGSATADTKYIYRGLSRRSFLRQYTLADNVEVSGAELENGILRVTIKRIASNVPEVRKIAINSPANSTRPVSSAN